MPTNKPPRGYNAPHNTNVRRTAKMSAANVGHFFLGLNVLHEFIGSSLTPVMAYRLLPTHYMNLDPC